MSLVYNELLGGETTAFIASGNAFELSARNLTNELRRTFEVGDSFFNQNWVTAPASTEARDGLGPTHNALSCSSCHSHDGRGKPPEHPDDTERGLLLRLSIPGPEGPVDEPAYGGQLQDTSIIGVPVEGRIVIVYEEVQGRYPDSTGYNLERRGDSLVGGATVGEDVTFGLQYIDHEDPSAAQETAHKRRESWRAWIVASSVGEAIDAECELETFTPTRQDPKKTPGIPRFTDCQQVVEGVLWTPPVPTPVLFPCVATELGEPDCQWLEIDCPAGRVVLGRGNYRNESDEFQLVSEGDSTVIAFYLHSDWDLSDDLYEHHAPWRRWVEEPQGGRGAKEMWEAPRM